jgi:hypothetical protein
MTTTTGPMTTTTEPEPEPAFVVLMQYADAFRDAVADAIPYYKKSGPC